jgi:arylsulfatase A-like enzyme
MFRVHSAALFLTLLPALLPAADPTQTRNVILVTADGLRWQDLFHGIDPLLAHEKSVSMDPSNKDADDRRRRFATRESLAPFFWRAIAKNGVVLSNVNVTNSFRVSYPGYSEILTGRANDDVIKGNDPIQQPNETVLEFLKRKLALSKDRVALFSSWDHFHYIAEHTPGSIIVNAGYQDSPSSPALSRLQHVTPTPWDEARHDSFTFELALEYLAKQKPRVLAISFDETDDWAHAKRYDRVLDMIHNFDEFLQKLWTTIQSMPEYRDSTTLIVTSDHGRGSTLTDWSGHGSKVQGADKIWMAIMGPDTPAAGEIQTHAEQRDIAPTMIKLLGQNPKDYQGATGAPIPAAFKP